ncbi:MAG: hypothetical protein ACOX0M_00595 [Salinivirgaceae bacterium]|jgi:hypothetical protein|nr:hypothetical protein [Bacteroidales bacterium]
MKKLIKLMPIVMFWAFISTGCVDDNNNNVGTETPTYKKIEKIFTGYDLQNVELNGQYFWNGERVNKIESYFEGAVSERVEIDYVSGSNTKIAEIRVFSLPSDIKSSNYLIRELRRILTFGKEKEDGLILTNKIVPIYVNNKVTRLNVFAENTEVPNEFILVGFVKIEYAGNYPNKMTTHIKTFTIPDFPPNTGIEEIEVSQNYLIWQNGNITTQYSKTMVVIEGGFDYMTNDSAVYTYDDKLNAYSSIKNINPMFDAEISSNNNISSFNRTITEYTEYGPFAMEFNATISYEYDTDYPTVATINATFDSFEETSYATYKYK